MIRAGGLERHTAEEILRIEPWGPHGVRIRASAGAIDPDAPGALESSSPSPDTELSVRDDGSAHLVNGRLAVEASANGRLRFLHAASGRELLADKRPYVHHPGPRVHAAGGRTEQHFEAYDGERLHGLGQHLHGRLDQKGCVIDLVQGNTVAAIPFLHSSRGYGLLWNNPAIGRVELGADTHPLGRRRRRAQSTTGSPRATPRPRSCDAYAAGHRTPAAPPRVGGRLLAVASCATARRTNSSRWHGSTRSAGCRCPSSSATTSTGRAWATGVSRRASGPTPPPWSRSWTASGCGWRSRCGRPSSPAATPSTSCARPGTSSGHRTADCSPSPGRRAVPKSRCVRWRTTTPPTPAHAPRCGSGCTTTTVRWAWAAFWLDACEPDLTPGGRRARRLPRPDRPPRSATSTPLLHARAVADGLRAAGDDRPLSLVRSAWAGSQRYGAALWSGDIPPTFDSLRAPDQRPG